jgi:hypothetical protein
MKLNDFLKNYPDIHLAQESDNQDILNFFNETSMSGNKVVIGYDRSPNFFDFLKYQSQNYFVFFTKKEKEITGIATLLLRPGYIHGHKTIVGYLGDLRVKQSKSAFIMWRDCYRDLINSFHEIEEFQGASHLITAVMDHNRKAQKALLKNTTHFLYHKLCPYEMINILTRNPFTLNHPHYQIKNVTTDTLAEYLNFLDSENKKKPFGFIYPDEFHFRLKHWDHFQLHHCYAVYDQDKIVGSFALWSPSVCKKIIIRKLSMDMKLLLSPLKLLNPPLAEGLDVKFLYLNQLELMNGHEVAIRDILHFVFDNKLLKGHHALSLCHFKPQNLDQYLNGFLKFSEPMGLYTVTNTTTQNNFPISIPGFEMSLV